MNQTDSLPSLTDECAPISDSPIPRCITQPSSLPASFDGVEFNAWLRPGNLRKDCCFAASVQALRVELGRCQTRKSGGIFCKFTVVFGPSAK